MMFGKSIQKYAQLKLTLSFARARSVLNDGWSQLWIDSMIIDSKVVGIMLLRFAFDIRNSSNVKSQQSMTTKLALLCRCLESLSTVCFEMKEPT